MSRNVAGSGMVLACICACTILVVGFVAAINLAVPQLATSTLAPSSSELLWIVDAYVVLFACLVIPAGALGDRYGRKGVLLAGLALVAVGAAISAGATGVPVMLVGRAVTGVGAACVLPNGLAVLINATEPHRRPHAIAIWAAMTGVGGVVGNVGGGAVLTTGSWRLLFVAVVPIALLCAAWVAVAAPRTSHHDRRLGLVPAALLTLATLALLLGIIQGPEQGWGSAVVIGAFAAALLLYVAWALGELRTEHPLLDPRLFRIPALRAACLGMLVVFFGMFGLFYLNASLLQYGRGFSVLETGLAITPMTVPMLAAARYVPALVAGVGGRTVLGAAFLATSVGLYGLATAIHQPYPAYAAWLVLVGIGITLALPSLTAAIAAALPREQAGVAGGLQATTRELGSGLGVAVIGTLLTAQSGHHRHVIAAYVAGAGSAIRVVAVIVLVAGLLVIAEMTWARRGSRPAGR